MRARLIEAILLSRRGVVLCCAVLVALLGLNAFIFVYNTGALLDQQKEVTHSQEVLAALNGALATIATTENAARGYILTGDRTLLRSYSASRRAIMPQVSHVQQLVHDNAQQEVRLSSLRSLLPGYLAHLDTAVDLVGAGEYSQAQALALDNHDKSVANAIQGVFDAMTRAELDLLQHRTTRAQQAAATTIASLIVAMGVDAVLLAGILLAIQRSFARRTQLAEERGRLLEQAQQAQAQAERAVKMRDEFFSLAAHELKTPLTTLVGNTQLLERFSGDFAPRERRLVAAIANGTQRLRLLADHLLDISRLEQGVLEINREPLDLVALVRRIASEVQHSTTRHTIRIAASEPQLSVMADRMRLEQVMHNLLANAIKYSPAGGTIVVTVGRDGDRAHLVIQDEGIGIPADALPHLFEPFYRAPNVDPHRFSGLGMGLYVVQEIVTRHGGAIAVESAEGCGTTVTIELPLSVGEPRGPEPRTPTLTQQPG